MDELRETRSSVELFTIRVRSELSNAFSFLNTIMDKFLLHRNITILSVSFMCFICNKRGFKRVDDSCLIDVNCRTIADNKRVFKRVSGTFVTVKQANRNKTKSPQNTYFAHLSVSV